MNAPRCGPRRVAVPWGLLGMVVLVATSEGWITRHESAISSLDVASYRFPKFALRAAARCEVLCFGDSLVKHGVAPRVLEERLGRSSFNLAVPGGMPASAYLLLRKVVESGGRPAAVLVDFKSRILSTDPRGLSRSMSALTTVREGLGLAWGYRDPHSVVALLLSQVFYSYRDRREIRSWVRRGFDPDWPLDFMPWSAYWRNWSLNRGGQFNEKNPQSISPQGPPNLNEYLREHWRCDPRNERYVVKFLELAAAHRLPVYWLIPPVHPRVQTWRDGRGADAPYERFVQEMQGRFPNVTVVDARHSGYGPDLFWDAVHLDRDGALAYSAEVATVLRERAGAPLGPRWIALPSVREFPNFRPAEDVAQSRRALDAPGEGVRR